VYIIDGWFKFLPFSLSPSSLFYRSFLQVYILKNVSLPDAFNRIEGNIREN